MAPSSTQQVLLSPAELSYLHTSLSLNPPIRPDARTPSQFRPLVAETDILPGTNGSARICFADGTEAIVGIKAEVEKSRLIYQHNVEALDLTAGAVDDDEDADEGSGGGKGKGFNEWVELSVEIPGFRDDDSMPVFLSAILSEALLADGELTARLWINRRFHWKLYLDVSHPFRGLGFETEFADFAALATFVISTTPSLSHYTPGSALCPPTETQIGAR
jgi:exosome complex component RRP42